MRLFNSVLAMGMAVGLSSIALAQEASQAGRPANARQARPAGVPDQFGITGQGYYRIGADEFSPISSSQGYSS